MNQPATRSLLSVDWTGGGRVVRDQRRAGQSDEAAIQATHTLVDTRDGGRGLSVLGPLDPPDHGDHASLRVAMPTSEVTNHPLIGDRPIVEVPGPTEPLSGLLVPMVAEILTAFTRAALDPGWDCVVIGSDLRAELVSFLGNIMGARSLTAVRSGAISGVLSSSLSGQVFDSDAEGWGELLADHLAERPGPVLAFDTTGVGSAVNAALAALPARSQIALFGPSAPGPVSVDFYRDIHAKNVTLLGIESRLGDGEASRALSLIEDRLIVAMQPEVGRVEGREGSIIPTIPQRLVVLNWEPASV